MDQSVLDVLQELRGEDEEHAGPSKRRRTKLNVQPGKSVVVPDSDDSDDSDTDDESDDNCSILSSDKENADPSGCNSNDDDDNESTDEDEDEDLEGIPFKELKFGMWVIVEYEEERFLGQVQETAVGKIDGRVKKEARVKCLEMPYGINEPQNFENGDGIFYNRWYRTNKIPEKTNLNKKGQRTRKTMWKY